MSYEHRRGRLTDDQVIAARKAFAYGYKSANQLASLYGMNTCTIHFIVQGCLYKRVGGPITWPGQRPLPPGKVRGRCWDVACSKPIADSGHAQRMHMCEDCFRINGGRKCGRTPSGKVKAITCRTCGKSFTYYVRPNGYCPRTCSRKCSSVQSGLKKGKRPKDLTKDRLYELYWGQDLTAVEIVRALGLACTPSSVLHWLISDGTPRRAQNWRLYPTCSIEGCDEPKHKMWNGIRWYGRLCKEHLRERDRNRSRIYQNELTDDRGAELVRHVGRFLVGLPESVKSDAQQEIVLAALSNELALPLSLETVRPFIVRAFRENADAYRFVSLAAPVADGEGVQTWGERLGLS